MVKVVDVVEAKDVHCARIGRGEGVVGACARGVDVGGVEEVGREEGEEDGMGQRGTTDVTKADEED